MEKGESNLNDTATFNDPLNGINLSMKDNIFSTNYIKEGYLACPVCGSKIVESNIIPHLENFHNKITYREVINKIKEKNKIIKTKIDEIYLLRNMFFKKTEKSVKKPNTKEIKDFKEVEQASLYYTKYAIDKFNNK